MNRETIKLAAVTLSGLLLGGLTGYLVAKKRIGTAYDRIIDEEVDRIKAYYGMRRSSGSFQMDVAEEELVQDKLESEDIMNSLGYTPYPEEKYEDPSPMEVKKERESRKITPEEEIDIDPNDELLAEMRSKRTYDDPYVITIDEFMDDFNDEYDKYSVTYFEGDDTLCDSREQVIPDVESAVGNEALTNFGLFSKDKNIVYVRNDRLSMDFEVAYDPRSYIDAVAGLKNIPKAHRRMREDD